MFYKYYKQFPATLNTLRAKEQRNILCSTSLVDLIAFKKKNIWIHLSIQEKIQLVTNYSNTTI